jgi:hypothetical protein
MGDRCRERVRERWVMGRSAEVSLSLVLTDAYASLSPDHGQDNPEG